MVGHDGTVALSLGEQHTLALIAPPQAPSPTERHSSFVIMVGPDQLDQNRRPRVSQA